VKNSRLIPDTLGTTNASVVLLEVVLFCLKKKIINQVTELEKSNKLGYNCSREKDKI